MPKAVINSKEFTNHNSRNISGLTVLKNNHKLIRRLREENGQPSHHGNKVWNSSILLMDYLKHHPPKKRSKVLEIGCGWSISAIYCAKVFQSTIAGLDIDKSVFPFAHLHAQINQVEITTIAKSYQRADGKLLADFDLVIGGDICFWDELSNPLFNLCRRAVQKGARVVIADPGRPPFQKMAQRVSVQLGGSLMQWTSTTPKTSGWILDTKPNIS